MATIEALPALDDLCGHYLTYRDFTECSDTWKKASLAGPVIPNVPTHPDTYRAIRELCEYILDPVSDRFGRIELTYGFASQILDRYVRDRAAAEGRPPNTTRNGDQHAGCELNTRGEPYCRRGGQGVDFRMMDSGMPQIEVAQWIVQHTPFDRLLFQGPGRPFHVSYGPEHTRYASGVRIPKTRFYPKPDKS